MGSYLNRHVTNWVWSPASATLEVPVLRVPTGLSLRLLSAYVFDSTAIAANTGIYVTCSVINRGTAGAGTAVMATGVGTAGLSAKTPKALTLSTTASELVADAGEQIDALLTVTSTGTGTSLAGCIEYVWSD